MPRVGGAVAYVGEADDKQVGPWRVPERFEVSVGILLASLLNAPRPERGCPVTLIPEARPRSEVLVER